MTDSHKAALKILALVDEYPSEPFSFERKQVLQKLEDLVAQHTQQVDHERDVSYQYGHDDGYDEGYTEAKDEYETRISELEDEIHELKDDIEQKEQDAFTEGYEAARIEYGLN